jgi:hypothetical protein
VTPVKSGDQGVEAGDVFAEISENAQFPGLRFFGGVEFPVDRSKRRRPEKNCALEDQELAGRDMLLLIWSQNGNSSQMVRRYIRDGSLFRENSAAKLGL